MTAFYVITALSLLLLWVGAGVILFAKSLADMFSMSYTQESTMKQILKFVVMAPIFLAIFLYSLIFERKRA